MKDCPICNTRLTEEAVSLPRDNVGIRRKFVTIECPKDRSHFWEQEYRPKPTSA